MESKRKGVVQYKQVKNDTLSRIELHQERKSDNWNEIILDDFLDIDFKSPSTVAHYPLTTATQTRINSGLCHLRRFAFWGYCIHAGRKGMSISLKYSISEVNGDGLYF